MSKEIHPDLSIPTSSSRAHEEGVAIQKDDCDVASAPRTDGSGIVWILQVGRVTQ